MLREMGSAPVGARILLAVEISEVLFSASQITATMSQTSVNAFIGTALRQTQISFFAEAPATSESEVELVDVRATTTPGEKKKSCETQDFTKQRRREALGPLQQAIMNRLLDAPPGDIIDLFELRKAMLRSHSGPAVSRAFRTLLDRGVIQAMVPTASGFEPDVGREGPLRFVRCAGGI
jgi:hypothetical protein